MKNESILFIVESPNKILTLKTFLPKNYIIKASAGHITEIADSGAYNMGIDPEHNFKTDYKLMKEKRQLVSELKQLAASCSKVILATDGDREGEAIAWHLFNTLKIPENKYERITYHELTKKAITEALAHPRKLDYELIDAALTRQKLDKIVGYRLSPIAWNKIAARSVGRCQSAGLKLIVDKEKEIMSFESTTFYDLYLSYSKINLNQTYKAKYIGTEHNIINHLTSEKEANIIIDQCYGYEFKINNIETKERKESPKEAFTTSSFQQEAASKLGMSVKEAMAIAQRLFEGIVVNGEHKALITYLRTDSTSLAPEFINDAHTYIVDNYGEDYYNIKANKKSNGKKDKNIQDGHEALRPVDLSITPEFLTTFITDKQTLKIYTLIFNRAIASLMMPARINDTIYSIINLGKEKHTFISNTKELKFAGYKAVYNYEVESEENDETEIKEVFKKNEILTNTKLNAVEKETMPPKRYTEASFIHTLDKLGIGRPSTYSTIISTLLDTKRDYCRLEKKAIIPSIKAFELIDFLEHNFSDIVDSKYTAELERQLDEINNKNLSGNNFLTTFYEQLTQDIKKTGETYTCPNCGSPLILKSGPYGKFYGCANYPNCRYIKSIKNKNFNKK